MIVSLTNEPLDVSAAEAGQSYPAYAQRPGEYFANCEPDDTVYGFAVSNGLIRRGQDTVNIRAGMYFCIPGRCEVSGDMLIAVRRGFRGLFVVGGPIEERGRLKYIDGCSDTLLVSPPKIGDPCLNHLHFPPNIQQTMHTHPTARVGVIVRGCGECVTPEGRTPLVPGVCWYLPAGAAHCFYTGDEGMDVIAWHPDSDTGPTDEDHPMIRRTIVEGVAAHLIPSIRTQEIVG